MKKLPSTGAITIGFDKSEALQAQGEYTFDAKVIDGGREWLNGEILRSEGTITGFDIEPYKSCKVTGDFTCGYVAEGQWLYPPKNHPTIQAEAEASITDGFFRIWTKCTIILFKKDVSVK